MHCFPLPSKVQCFHMHPTTATFSANDIRCGAALGASCLMDLVRTIQQQGVPFLGGHA
jgi:hypothetical protein